MPQRIFVFKTTEVTSDGRPYLLAIPEDKITELRTTYGSDNIYAIVNGTKVNCSFERLIKELGTPHNCF
jgi:hypothetical protein